LAARLFQPTAELAKWQVWELNRPFTQEPAGRAGEGENSKASGRKKEAWGRLSKCSAV